MNHNLSRNQGFNLSVSQSLITTLIIRRAHYHTVVPLRCMYAQTTITITCCALVGMVITPTRPQEGVGGEGRK